MFWQGRTQCHNQIWRRNRYGTVLQLKGIMVYVTACIVAKYGSICFSAKHFWSTGLNRTLERVLRYPKYQQLVSRVPYRTCRNLLKSKYSTHTFLWQLRNVKTIVDCYWERFNYCNPKLRFVLSPEHCCVYAQKYCKIPPYFLLIFEVREEKKRYTVSVSSVGMPGIKGKVKPVGNYSSYLSWPML